VFVFEFLNKLSFLLLNYMRNTCNPQMLTLSRNDEVAVAVKCRKAHQGFSLYTLSVAVLLILSSVSSVSAACVDYVVTMSDVRTVLIGSHSFCALIVRLTCMYRTDVRRWMG